MSTDDKIARALRRRQQAETREEGPGETTPGATEQQIRPGDAREDASGGWEESDAPPDVVLPGEDGGPEQGEEAGREDGDGAPPLRARPDDPLARAFRRSQATAEPTGRAAPQVGEAPDGTRAGPPADSAGTERRPAPPEGRAEGPTPRPDSDRFKKAMERSGAYRGADAPRTRRRVQQEERQEEKRQKKFLSRYRELMDVVSRSSDELGYDPDRPVTEVPAVPPGLREVEAAAVIPDRAWVRILFHETRKTYLYQVIEPELSDNEEEVLQFLRDTLIRTMDGRRALADEEAETVLLEAIRQAIVDHRILVDEVGARRIEYYLVRDFLGFGRIDVLMRDPMIEDISCDGPRIPIYLFHRKYESVRTTVAFEEDLDLDSFVIRLAQRSGKHISIADPLLDATLPDGSRLQATLSREVTTRGSSFTIRKFRGDPLTPPALIRYNTMSPQMAAYFWFAMEGGNSFILAGGTASGKTTSLNAICQFIPPEKKVVSIEDTREINLVHENWIAGVTRSGFGGEYIGGRPAGSIDMYKLLEAALRQRPEYLLVGEVRGPEALTLFQAMATGHAVYSTMHADSAPSAVYRLENKPIEVPRMMLQTLDILMLQVQQRIGDRMVRRIREVVEIVGLDPETKELLTNTAFEWDGATDEHVYLGKSYIMERLMESKNLSEAEADAEWQTRTRILEWMVEHGMDNYRDVSRIVSEYYRDPAGLLAQVESGRPAEEVHDADA